MSCGAWWTRGTATASRPCTPRRASALGPHWQLFWRPAPRKQKLTPEQLAKRKEFVDKYISKTSDWWAENIGLVLDGVTVLVTSLGVDHRKRSRCDEIIRLLGRLKVRCE